MNPSPQGGAGYAPILGTLVVGIDVGGPRKGFHAVAIRDGVYLDKIASPDPLALATWCIQVDARAVAIDAPCRWSRTGPARPAERALAAEGIHAFATPSLEAAEGRDFYRWMLNGAALYRVIEAHFRLFDGGNAATGPVCCETFPQAVACTLAGRVVPARGKGVVRRALLREAGIATARWPISIWSMPPSAPWPPRRSWLAASRPMVRSGRDSSSFRPAAPARERPRAPPKALRWGQVEHGRAGAAHDAALHQNGHAARPCAPRWCNRRRFGQGYQCQIIVSVRSSPTRRHKRTQPSTGDPRCTRMQVGTGQPAHTPCWHDSRLSIDQETRQVPRRLRRSRQFGSMGG